MKVRRLAVIGLGLIGGSLARALREAKVVDEISAFDPDPRRRERALDLGVADRVEDNAADAVRDADVIVLSVPVLHTAEALRALLPGRRRDAVVTDVGSTKQSVLADVAAVCEGQVPPWFVAGHPIAGTEKSGVENSSAGLFRGHRVILTPHPGQDPTARSQVAALWTAAGARVVEMPPERHDAIFAATSHLPHVLAFSFVDMLSRMDTQREIFPNAGGGFRDFTRIASSSPEMWHDIIRANAPRVTELLERQLLDLQELLDAMKQGRWDELKARFERARAARESYLGQIE